MMRLNSSHGMRKGSQKFAANDPKDMSDISISAEVGHMGTGWVEAVGTGWSGGGGLEWYGWLGVLGVGWSGRGWLEW